MRKDAQGKFSRSGISKRPSASGRVFAFELAGPLRTQHERSEGEGRSAGQKAAVAAQNDYLRRMNEMGLGLVVV